MWLIIKRRGLILPLVQFDIYHLFLCMVINDNEYKSMENATLFLRRGLILSKTSWFNFAFGTIWYLPFVLVYGNKW